MSQSDGMSSPVLSRRVVAGAINPVEGRNLRGRSRFGAVDRTSLPSREEALIIDERAELRPAQVVESKLTRMLENASVPVSHLQMRGLLRAR
jgi:hypothetical protein